MTKEVIYGVAWFDHAFGLLTLHKPDAESAIASALSIRSKGAGKVSKVRAVRVTADDVLEDLLP